MLTLMDKKEWQFYAKKYLLIDLRLFFLLQHDAPVKTVHWIKAPNYSCVMTGSWDKTLKVGLKKEIKFISMHVTVDDVNFCDSLECTECTIC